MFPLLDPIALTLNIGLNMLLSDYFMPYLDSLLGYSTGEFYALQIIVFTVFCAVDIFIPHKMMILHFCLHVSHNYLLFI